MKSFAPEQYTDKVILAPMVRTNSLPFRQLCLEYGADLVYTEELIDHRLAKCHRLENKVLNTIDFVDEQGELILRTRSEEKDRLILQIGSNCAERAVRAAQLVANDVAGIDFNFGCPKSFSLSGGMGAALLDKPGEIEKLLKTSVATLFMPVTCKIRILPDLNKTLELVKLIEDCGVSAIAVHARTKDQRSHDDNQDQVIKAIAETVKIPVIANGGSNNIFSYAEVIKFKQLTDASSVMIGRAAMRNPSIFKSDNEREPVSRVIERFLQLAVLSHTYTANVKYVLQTMMACGNYGGDFVHEFHKANDYATLCDLFRLTEWFKMNQILTSKSCQYDNEAPANTWLERYIEKKLESLKRINPDIDLVTESLPYNPKLYGKLSPKSQVHEYVMKRKLSQPEVEVLIVGELKKGRFVCSMFFEGTLFVNKSHSMSKKAAEHATAMLICQRFGLVKLDNYRTRVNACSKNIT